MTKSASKTAQAILYRMENKAIPDDRLQMLIDWATGKAPADDGFESDLVNALLELQMNRTLR